LTIAFGIQVFLMPSADGRVTIAESATVNLNIVDQQPDVIQKQVPVYAFPFTEGSGVESVSTCSCLPRSADSSRPIPARIEYHCGDLSNRTFSLPCSGGVCESEALPSCTEPMEWEESASVTFHHCEETLFNGDTLFCSNAGSNGTRETKIRSNIGGGVVEEVNVTPCKDCTDLLTWTALDCTSSTDGMECRRRGNDVHGFESVEKDDNSYKCEEDGINYADSQDLLLENAVLVNSWQECQKLCEAFDPCKFWSWHKPTNKYALSCALAKSYGRKSNDSVVSGPKVCP